MTKKVYHVEISDAAVSMLNTHIDFLARVSKKSALRVMNTILDAIDLLNNNPERYPIYQNRFIGNIVYHQMTIEGRYIVLYEICANNVYVDYVLDCRQDNKF